MSMWSPQSPPHLQSPGPRAVGRCCCCCSPACWGLASLLPPSPARAVGTAPGAWGKPNCQNSSHLQSHLGGWESSRLCLVCPSWQHPDPEPTAPKESPRQTKPVAEPYSVPPGPASLEWHTWPVSIYCLHMCRPLGPLACCLCPQAWCHHPRQALPGPSQDNRGTKRAQSEPSPVPPLPSLPLPGQARAGPHRNLSLLLLF